MQRYFSNELIDNSFLLSEEDMYHIKKVMRMNNGEKIEVVHKQELFLTSLKDNKAEIIEKINSNYKNKSITLCIPLLSDQKMSFVFQKATELGVSKIIPVLMERSVVKLKDEEKKIVRWQKICKEASEQSKRLDIPEITNVTKLKDLNLNGLKIMCSTVNKDNTLKKVLAQKYDEVTIIVGPEGGLTNKEEEILIEKGFTPTTLGSNILRVETVPIVLLGILNYEMMEW